MIDPKKNYIQNLVRILESKDHLIDKLDLTDDQKAEIIAFFKKHPNFESKIDWNRKDLTYDDFKELLATEGTTRNQIKKYGISGQAQIEDLVEGKDYEIVVQDPKVTIYHVKTFKASEVLAKPTTPPLGVTGRWCIAGRNYSPGTRDQHWLKYKRKHIEFFFVFTASSKYAVTAIPKRKEISFEYFGPDDNPLWGWGLPIDDFYMNMLKTEAQAIYDQTKLKPGPAGGYIIYDKGDDEGGWRYIECTPTDFGSNNDQGKLKSGFSAKGLGFLWPFGYARRYDQRTGEYNFLDTETSKEIGAGKENTERLIQTIGEKAFIREFMGQDHSTGDYAAKICTDYTLNGYDDWYLPSAREMLLIKDALWERDGSGMVNSKYWTSSLISNATAYFVDCEQSEQNENVELLHKPRSGCLAIRPVRYFK